MSVERVAELEGVGRFHDTPDGFVSTGSLFVGGNNMTNIIVFRPRSLPAGVLQVLASCASLGGWYFAIQADGLIRWRLRTGVDTTTNLNVTAPPVVLGDLWTVICTKDPTDAYVYYRGVQIGTVGCVGWTGDTVNRIGAFPGIGPFFGDIVALMTSDTQYVTPANIPALDAQVRDNLAQGRDLRTGLGGLYTAERYWDAADIDWVADTWADRVGGGVLTGGGTHERVGVPGRSL